MKAKRSFYNIIFGFISQLVAIGFGITIPRLFVLTFGSEVNGFMSSIAQILVYMSLLEAGVGAASIQALYKPISEYNKGEINGILAATSKYYKKTGVYYLVGVITMAIIYPLCIKSNISKQEIFLIILLTGLGGVINYFFQAKITTFLTAEGKSYVVTNISMAVNSLISVMKIILILLGYNIVCIQLSYFVINLLQIIIIWIYVKKNYKWIDFNVQPNYSAISQKNSVLIHQISTLIFNNTDVLILTFFCGLKVVSVYVMYNMVFQMINNAIFNLNSGVVFIFGSSYHENKSKFLNLYNSYELYYMAIVFALYEITYILILPFMRLYTAGVTDVNYIQFWIPVFFVASNLLSLARIPSINAINVAGHFKKTQYRSIIESVINIVVSLICVHSIGIYGVLLGTIVALLYRTNDIIIYTSRNILKRSSLITYKRWIIYIFLFVGIAVIAKVINITPSSYVEMAIVGIVLAIILIPIFFIVGSIIDIKTFKFTRDYSKKYLKNFSKRKIK